RRSPAHAAAAGSSPTCSRVGGPPRAQSQTRREVWHGAGAVRGRRNPAASRHPPPKGAELLSDEPAANDRAPDARGLAVDESMQSEPREAPECDERRKHAGEDSVVGSWGASGVILAARRARTVADACAPRPASGPVSQASAASSTANGDPREVFQPR